MSEILSKTLPILFLIFFGYLLQKRKFISENAIDDLNKIVIQVSLPSVLFVTFLNMSIGREHFFLVMITVVLLVSFYLSGTLLNKIKRIAHPLIPFMVTGYAFGLLGVPLFGTVFGIENLDRISILGVGHEFFMWFGYLVVLKAKLGGERFSYESIKNFFKTPIIISIVLGVLFNLIGVDPFFQQNIVLKGIYTTIEYLSNLATPLILIIIGFGLKFNRRYMKQSAVFIILRLLVAFTIGYSIKYMVIDRFVSPDPIFDYAYFTTLILPPPFSLPIFVGEYSSEENKELANNTVVLGTVVSVVIFIVFVLTLG